MAETPDVKHLFEPRSIAVIGASHNEQKIGSKILRNIVKGGYNGNVYPINPEGGMILDKITSKPSLKLTTRSTWE
jgi:acyl-CoA synthetase (NDP forming)